MPQRQTSNARAVVAAQPQQQGAASPPNRALIAQKLQERLSVMDAAALAGLSPTRLFDVAMATYNRTPGLWTCDPMTIVRAIAEAGQLGLEPTGIMGGAYLVPRGGQATLLVGYRGLVILAMRSGLVQRVEARVVREKDEFDYAYGLEPYLLHKPSREADPGPYTHAYAVIFYRDGSRQFDVMTVAEIEATRKRSSASTSGPVPPR